MDRQQLLKRIEDAWTALKESVAGMTDLELSEPGVAGDWSVKDILAHVTTWEQEALKYLPVILRGDRPPRYSVMYGGIDAFNARMAEEKRGLSLAEVQKQMEDTHRKLIEVVHEAPEEEIRRETAFRRRIRLDTYSHYPHHTRAIREWREGKNKVSL
jgi:hypothetical protein